MPNDDPVSPSNSTDAVPATGTVADPGRRQWLKKVGKKAYATPTLITLIFTDTALAQLGSPPPPPFGQVRSFTSDPLQKGDVG